MKIILLTGKPNTGKTTTFNLLYSALANGIKNPPLKQGIGGKRTRDFECIFQYKGKKVALFSQGDIMYVITGAIIKYSGIVDCLIIAHSRKGRIMDKIRLAVLANKQHCAINKTRNNQNDCSQIIANI